MVDVYVISGGPGTGKTTTVNAIEKKGYKVMKEVARKLAGVEFKGKSIKEIDMKVFQSKIFDYQINRLKKLKSEKAVFSDRGLGDTLAYSEFHGVKPDKEDISFAKSFKYKGIFILDFLDDYAKDELRQESEAEQKKIHKLIIKEYKKLGYKVVIVPVMGVEERVDFILSRIRR